MAKLRTFQFISGDIWTIRYEIDPKSVSQADNDLIEKFGEPEINVGGSFLTSNSALTFSFPDSYIKLITGLPYSRDFDARALPFNQGSDSLITQIAAYDTVMNTRFNSAFTTLRAQNDTFTGEKVVTI